MHTHDPSWSTRLKLSLLAGGLAATLLALSGCATVDAQTTAYVGVEHPAPTLPSEVVVLRSEPPSSVAMPWWWSMTISNR
jgi:hypothetical protein